MRPAGIAARGRSALDGALVFVVALIARLTVVAWCAGRFPPAADGVYYDTLARRIADGHGYTWLWPDGAVTYVAHYPVGYPAALGAIYAAFGPSTTAAGILNAVVGALGALAVGRLAARFASRRVALYAGLAVALHPGLVAYTPALMTEGVTAALLAVAAWAALRARRRHAGAVVLLGVIVGAATFVRPQSLLLAPVLGLFAAPPHFRLARRIPRALLATAVALALLAPWTQRNHERLGRAALVSVNGGWNLLIGTNPEAHGGWAPLAVPDNCKTVWDEAGKDLCFGEAAKARIAADPFAWVALAPDKLATTFNYAGAAGYYLHASNPESFSEGDKVGLGAVETLYERLVLLFALLGLAKRGGLLGKVLGLACVPFAFVVQAWPAYGALALGWITPWRRADRGLGALAAAILGATMLTHAVFFGAGRYALVTFPLLTGAAIVHYFARPRSPTF